jgi:hypothetical protein
MLFETPALNYNDYFKFIFEASIIFGTETKIDLSLKQNNLSYPSLAVQALGL